MVQDVGERLIKPVRPEVNERRVSRMISGLAPLGVGRYLFAVDVAALLIATRSRQPLSAAWMILILFVALLNAGSHLYRSRLTLSVLDDLPRLTGNTLVASALVLLLGSLTSLELDGQWWTMVMIGWITIIGGRWVAYWLVHQARKHQVVAHRTMIIGTGYVGQQLATTMMEHREYGLDPVCFFDPTTDRDDLMLPVLRCESLTEAVHLASSNVIVVAFSMMREPVLVQVLREASRLSTEIFFVPRLFELHSTRSPDLEDLDGLPILRLRRASHRTHAWRLKRLFDILLALFALIVLSPVLLLVGLATLLSLGRPVLFQQDRVGLDQEHFTILKFRSMANAPVEVSDQEWRVDSRSVGRIGRFVRATSLDELPQLWNVVRGDMSLVGPRPERPIFVEDFSEKVPAYSQRHRVPTGITGLAQIRGLRGDTPITDRARFDNAYVENWSLWNDIKIILRTVASMLKREGS